MARLEAVAPDRTGPMTRAMYALARRRFGSVPEPSRWPRTIRG